MKTIKLTSTKSRIAARTDREELASCTYSGNDGYTAARRTVIEQLKSQFADFDLVEANLGTGETLTTNYRNGEAVDQAWT